MALINCPECDKELSSKASACPSCGCPLDIQESASVPLPSAPPKLEAEKFNVLDNTNKLGPYTIEEINKGLRNRSISVDATILNQKNNSWVKVSEFPNVVIPVFHVMRGNETFGPYTLEELNTHFNSGVINEADMVLNPDTESWETIGEMDGVDYRQYYVQQTDGTTGPYILPHIIHYLKNGDLDPSDLIKTENSLWMPMASIAELHTVVQPHIDERKARNALPKEKDLSPLFWVLAVVGLFGTVAAVLFFTSGKDISLSIWIWNIFAILTWLALYFRIIYGVCLR